MGNLIGFIINAVVAALAGIVTSLLSQLLPTRGNDADAKWLVRRKRAVGAFVIVWLGVVTYGCIDMQRPHHS